MRNVTARQLQVFVEAAETLSFMRVAERLRLTPSAISFQIKQVELQTGSVLFDRIGRRVALTAAGQMLLSHARLVLEAIRDLDAAMQGLQGHGMGRVRLGLVSTAKYIVPHMIARFRTTAPGATVVLREGNRSETLALLLSGEVDLAVMGQPPEAANVLATRFAAHPSVIIAPPAHALCGVPAIAAGALALEWFIVRENGSGTRTLSDRFFQSAGFTPRVAMETSSNEMIKQAVMAGMGLALLSQHTISLERSLGLLKVIAVDGFPVMRSWFVVQRRSAPFLPAQAALQKYLIGHGQEIIEQMAQNHLKARAGGRDA